MSDVRDTGSPRNRRHLGRLQPKRKLIGPWLPVLSLTLVLGALVVHGLAGEVPGLASAAVGTVLAWFGREAKWRGIASLALYLGIFLVLFFLVVLLIGRENIGRPMQ